MAKTALDLGEHWENFIDEQVRSGRYASADDLVRNALSEFEERGRKLEELRRHIDEGWQQAERGEFVEDFSFETLIAELDAEEK